MDRQPVLEGERLLLRPLRAEDWDALFAVASDPRIWAVHPARDRWREPEFRAFFADALARGGALAVVDKHAPSGVEGAGGAIVGSSRFQGYEPANADGSGGSVEIGWTFLARSHWGGGYNAEMKRLMLNHAFASVERVRFVVGAGNAISRRAMEKIGGRLSEQTRMVASGGQPVEHVVFEIDRAGFASGPLAKTG